MNDETNSQDESQAEKVYHCPSCETEFSGEDVPADMKCPDCDTDLAEGAAPTGDDTDEKGEEDWDEDWDDDDDDDDEDEEI